MLPRRSVVVGALAAFGIASQAPAAPERPYRITEERVPCDDYDPLRSPFFGDTHVHTTYSQDASTQDTRATPRDAYRFAKGEPLGIQPFDGNGKALRRVSLLRPLDFAAVTDHSEQLGEVQTCRTPGRAGYSSWVCRIYRSFPRVAFYLMNAGYMNGGERWAFCGEAGARCLAAARGVWVDTQDAAEGAYDRSAACRFTSFVGYEWTGSPSGNHLHRNVLFRNERVPALPISVMETGHSGLELWKRLDAECRVGLPGCEALTIPHNSNLSDGTQFSSAVVPRESVGVAEAPLRARYERLAEVMQHKGDSECRLLGDTTDEACGFEKVTPHSPLPLIGGPLPARRLDYVREALKRGLVLEQRLGTNPFKLGLVASTDTHLATPGLTAERGHPGHGGAGPPARDAIPVGLPDALEFNPGGLAVFWAEENARDALFAAMLRREAYGTSGTRPTVRFFGGWGYDAGLCAARDFARRGYAGGVPMGGDLPERPVNAGGPAFAVTAARDPLATSAPLQRIEIVKGWVEGAGLREKVVVVAGGPNDAGVDLSTCQLRGSGADQLCTVWRDPEFDADLPAFYYARVLENPSCRWSQWACIDAAVDCADPGTIGAGFEACCSEKHRRTVQERAWTSPIWYTPARQSADPQG